MVVIITYDVSTITSSGKKRLRQVAKACVNFAQRVQNSVFEADLDYGTFLKLKDHILKIIDPNLDSIRFYYLGNNWKHRIESYGVKHSFDPEGPIII